MKKATLLLMSLLTVTVLFAQVTRDKVIVEIGTGTWCQYCPGAAMGADDLIENGWPVAIIENHNDDPFSNNYSNARNTFYGVPGFPTAYFDGGNSVVGGNHTQSMYPYYWPKVQTRMGVPSPVTISAYGSHTGLTYDIMVTVTKVAGISGSNIRLQTTLTESHIVYSWQGMTECNFVDRLMVPDQNGTTLNFDNGDVLEIPLTFTLQQGWSLPNMELVIFVQTNSNKDILNGYKVKLAFLAPPPPPLEASFTSDTTSCVASEVQFTDQSAGIPTGWYWEFPGGTPDSSRLQNPVITYNEPGKYDVTLIVSRGLSKDTAYMPEYINVFALPTVTFDSIPDACLYDPPFELTQGSPAGGVYSGLGVEDNYFHPLTAHAGDHIITYTYTDENGCVNTAEQNIHVDACTGVPENKGVEIVTLPNPSQGSFKLGISGLEVMMNLRIINSNGKTVYQKDNIQINGDYNTTIDLTGNSNGIYYIQLEGKKSTYSRKIILQK